MGLEMLPLTVAACLLGIFLHVEATFDCKHPPPNYTLDSLRHRFYRVLKDVLWNEASEKCKEDGTQLGIAYTAADYKEMTEIGGGGKALSHLIKPSAFSF